MYRTPTDNLSWQAGLQYTRLYCLLHQRMFTLSFEIHCQPFLLTLLTLECESLVRQHLILQFTEQMIIQAVDHLLDFTAFHPFLLLPVLMILWKLVVHQGYPGMKLAQHPPWDLDL